MGLRGNRTFGVSGSSRSPATTGEEYFNQNLDIGNQVSFPGGEYGGGTVYPRNEGVPQGDVLDMDTIEIAGDQARVRTPAPVVGDQLQPTQTSPSLTNQEKAAQRYLDESDKQKAKNEQMAYAGAAISVIKATGGVINANSKYAQTVNQNNFNIQQAELETMRMESDAQRQMLQEQTKGEAKGDRALLSAIARGQSAGGDLAQRAVKTQSVIAAQNRMVIEINSMRQIFNMQSQIRMLESENNMAKINRDLEVSQAITSGVMGAGMSMMGGM